MKIRTGLVIGFAAGVAGLGGCAGFASYPPVEGSVAIADPNTLNIQESMIAAISHVLTRRPLTSPYAVNLPSTMLRERQVVVIRRLNDEHARLLTRETAGLPMVHVARVWIRETRSQVDVIRPIEGLTNPDGTQAYEAFTVSLQGGLRPWRVTDVRRWSIATVAPPAASYADGWDGGAQREPDAPAVAETPEGEGNG